MKAEKVYALLDYMHQSNSIYEDRSVRLLKFLYDDCYSVIDELLKKMEESNFYNLRKHILEEAKKDISKYVDGDNSILTYFDEMIRDDRSAFLNKFFGKTDIFFKMFDNHLYREEDFNPISYVFNIYIMLKFYHEYKDDFDTFNKLVNDFSFFIDVGYYSDNFNFYHKKEAMDTLIGLDGFTKIPALEDELISFFKNLFDTQRDYYHIYEYIRRINRVKSVLDDFSKLQKNNSNVSVDNCNYIISDILKNHSDDKCACFYTSILLFGDRYKYMKKQYEKHIDKAEFMAEIIDIVGSLDNGIFAYLDGVKNDDKDSFISCMDIVFDSDTYFELLSKLGALESACTYYTLGSYDKMMSYIDSLNSVEHKKVFAGKKIMYNSFGVNLIDKPDSIVERMKNLYNSFFKVVDSGIQYSIDAALNNSEHIKDFESEFDQLVCERVAALEKGNVVQVERTFIDKKSFDEHDDLVSDESEELGNPLKHAETLGSKDNTFKPFEKFKSIFT